MTFTYLNFSVCFHLVHVWRSEENLQKAQNLGQQVWWEAPGLQD